MASECKVAEQTIKKQFNSQKHKDLLDICNIIFPFKDAFPEVYNMYSAALTLGVSTGVLWSLFLNSHLCLKSISTFNDSQSQN